MAHQRAPKERHIPTWAATVGDCKRKGVRVQVTCDRCGVSRAADLDAIIAERGEAFSLWNRRPHCHTPGCKGRVGFHFSPGEGTPFRPMRTWRTVLD